MHLTSINHPPRLTPYSHAVQTCLPPLLIPHPNPSCCPLIPFLSCSQCFNLATPTPLNPKVTLANVSLVSNTALLGGGLYVGVGSRCRRLIACYRLKLDERVVVTGAHTRPKQPRAKGCGNPSPYPPRFRHSVL